MVAQVAQEHLVAAAGGSAGTAPSMGGTGGGAAAPQFNVVGNSGVNQLAETMQGRSAQAPIQAYVVAQNVTTAQSLNRNIVSNASLGQLKATLSIKNIVNVGYLKQNINNLIFKKKNNEKVRNYLFRYR